MKSSKAFYESVELPQTCVNQYNHAFFLRNYLQKPDLFQSMMKEVEQELVERLPVLENDVGEIECYEPGQFSVDTLKNMFMDDIRPIVIRGYARDHYCVRHWTPEYLKNKYGSYKTWYSTTEQLVNDSGMLLSDFIDSVLSGSKNRAYVENLCDIFNTYPELHDQIGLEKIAKYLGDFASYHKIAQLFIGGLGTGAVFHCANELNCFLNIYGKKQWNFVHPKYSAAMYSTNFNLGIFVGSLVKHNAPKGFLEAEQPLYNRIPKLRITLEPGDMLINPPWWWHAVNNVTPSTIAVATRWEIQADNIRQNPLYDFVQSFRKVRLTSAGKKMSPTDVVVPDAEIRKKYVSYDQMGWKA